MVMWSFIQDSVVEVAAATKTTSVASYERQNEKMRLEEYRQTEGNCWKNLIKEGEKFIAGCEINVWLHQCAAPSGVRLQ